MDRARRQRSTGAKYQAEVITRTGKTLVPRDIAASGACYNGSSGNGGGGYHDAQRRVEREMAI